MAIKLGFQGKLFRNTGTYGTPVWAAVNVVRDLTQNVEDDEWDATTRGSGGFAQSEQTIRKGSIDFQVIWDSADTQLAAILAAYLARTSLDMAVLDGAASGAGSQGLRASFKVFKFSRNEALRDGMSVDITLKPSYEVTNVPQWVTFA